MSPPRVDPNKKYFKVAVGPKAMSAYIPAKQPVDPEVLASWRLADMQTYLANLGFEITFGESQWTEFRRALRKSAFGFPHDYVLLTGIEPVEPVFGSIIWYAEKYGLPRPYDLCIEGEPIIEIIPPAPPKDGLDVYGRPVPPRDKRTPPRPHLILDPEFSTSNMTSIFALKSGQAKIESDKLRFSSQYTVSDLLGQNILKVDFPCDVKVSCDLQGSVDWKVRGNIAVSGHWSASGIEVFGNAKCRSGIQTNMNGVIKIHGDLTAPFIQLSRIGIGGSLTVDSAILQSDIRVLGDISILGNPGAIMGSTVFVFGGLSAKRLGSEAGRPTRLIAPERDPDEATPPIRVKLAAQGSILDIRGTKINVKSDMPIEQGRAAPKNPNWTGVSTDFYALSKEWQSASNSTQTEAKKGEASAAAISQANIEKSETLSALASLGAQPKAKS